MSDDAHKQAAAALAPPTALDLPDKDSSDRGGATLALAGVAALGQPVQPSDVDAAIRLRDADERIRRLQAILEAWQVQQRVERKMRRSYATALIWILGSELALIFAAFFLTGLGLLKVERWMGDGFLLAALAQSSALILVVVKYLFPERSSDVLRLVEVMSKHGADNKSNDGPPSGA